MKTRCLALVLLLTSVAFAQAPSATPKTNAGPSAKSQAAPPTAPATTPQASKPGAEPAPGSAVIPPDAVVLTINGLCDAKNAKGECKTTMTRAQFDKLVAAFFGESPDQPVQPQQRRRLATQLVHNMVFSTEAKKQGLDKSPEAQQLYNWVDLQVLSELERRSLQKKSEPTPEEIQKYYNDNQDRYSELSFSRLMIPLHGGADNKLTEPDLKKLADDLRQRATTGVDFKVLENEAYDKLGLKNPPETKLTLHPNEISMSHQAAKQLKPGEFSDVIKDANGFYVYKLESKQVTPLDKVKAEISKTLAPQMLRKAVEDLDKSEPADYSQDYFGPTPPSGPGAGRPPMMPPAGGPKPPTPPASQKPPMAPPAAAPKPSAPAAPAAPAGTTAQPK